MNPTAAALPPRLAVPPSQRLARLARALHGAAAWLKEHLAAQAPAQAHPASEGPRGLGARPWMAAAWFGSLGPGPMCSPGQAAIGFEPGYKD
jgi:hypothetical protein